jgi:hypothetical protein
MPCWDPSSCCVLRSQRYYRPLWKGILERGKVWFLGKRQPVPVVLVSQVVDRFDTGHCQCSADATWILKDKHHAQLERSIEDVSSQNRAATGDLEGFPHFEMGVFSHRISDPNGSPNGRRACEPYRSGPGYEFNALSCPNRASEKETSFAGYMNTIVAESLNAQHKRLASGIDHDVNSVS